VYLGQQITVAGGTAGIQGGQQQAAFENEVFS
jgi:hypothetical protein